MIEWNLYITNLGNFFIHLRDEETNKLIWTKNGKDGSFYAKMGYDVAMEREHNDTELWWWTKIWKILGPLKTILMLWPTMSNKLLQDFCGY